MARQLSLNASLSLIPSPAGRVDLLAGCLVLLWDFSEDFAVVEDVADSVVCGFAGLPPIALEIREKTSIVVV